MHLERITTHTKPVNRPEKWHVIDAEGERLGRLATRVAGLLQGKHRPDFSHHQLSGDFVIVLNAAKIAVSGKKMTQKTYYRHTGYVGHLRSRTLDEMLEKFPERVIEMAVKGMLPRNKLARQMLRRLKVYSRSAHPHEAQVNAGTGAPKQAPASPPTSARDRRRAAQGTTAALAEEAVAVEEMTAEEPQVEAVAEEAFAVPALAPRKRAPAKAKAAPIAKPKAATIAKPKAKAPAKKKALVKPKANS
jgi:large subunit ribosomal protein L13